MESAASQEGAHVFVALPFSDTFGEIYSVISQAVADRGLRTVSTRDIHEGAAPFIENIYNAIEQAGIVIGITCEAGASVYYEVEYAKHRNKQTLLLIDGRVGSPPNTDHIEQLEYSRENLESLRSDLQDWLDDIQSSSQRLRGPVLTRGEVFSTVVDGTFYLQRTRPSPSKSLIQESLAKGLPMPQRLLYLTEEGQETYLLLCEDPDYEYYHETLRYVGDNRSGLVDCVLEHCRSTEVDFISLGPGNGQKDAVLLRELLKRARSGEYTYYYPYDVSGGLLLESMRTILARRVPLERLRVKAIEADIAHLADFPKVFDFRAEPNVYSLLGGLDNTGNEVTLLNSLYRQMGPRDCLLLEIRKQVRSGPQALGNIELNRRLDLAPLDYIGATVDPETVQYNEVTTTSSIPKARTVAAVVPELELHADPDSDGAQPETIKYRNLPLFSVHYYDAQEVEQVLENCRFQVLMSDEQANSLFYICAKLPPRIALTSVG